MTTTFAGWWIEKNDDGDTAARFRDDIRDDELGDGDVAIDVRYSSINYKDGMALAGRPGIVRTFPLIPGIDLLGTVTSSSDPRWSAGDAVLLNGAGIGESRNGGLAERARVPGDTLVRVPAALGDERAAALGTAGFTAMLSVLAIERHGVRPGDGPVLVTGAAGGVGSVVIMLLARLGYEVVASSGRAETEGEYLRSLGASRVIDRETLSGEGKPLQSESWAAVADAVGSHTLVNAIAQLRYGGIATSCGLAQGTDLPGTVLPFILRGVHLAGINSVLAPRALREEAWARLAGGIDLGQLDSMTSSLDLAEASSVAEGILAGEVRGRTVVKVASSR